MSQIPTFLRSLAALVRQRVADGKAVHVTADHAQELELLAGLEWDKAKTPDLRTNHALDAVAYAVGKEETLEPRAVASADIALGWLLASRPRANRFEDMEDRDILVRGEIDRAAVCAELAVMAPAALPLYSIEVPQRYEDALIAEAAKALEQYGMGLLPKIEAPIMRQWCALDGTREGARAAWAFLVLNLPQLKQHFDLRETYRRELEAMK